MKFKIQNKQLFYTGLGFQVVPLLIALFWGLSLLDYTWFFASLTFLENIFETIFSVDNLKYYLIALFIILYEGTSFLLMWAGCKK